MKIKVIFRKYPTGEVIAFFPELPGSSNAGTCLNYMRIGQHGIGVASCEGTTPASLEEYKDLYDELTAFIGYNLTIVSRFTYKMYKARARQLREMTK